MMPIAPVRQDGKGNAVSGTLTFCGYSPVLNGSCDLKESVRRASEKFGRGSPFIMVDVEGIAAKTVDVPALKKMHSKKMSIWLMTGVTSLDDVFDAFCIGIDSLMIPYHLIVSDPILLEICKISDSTVPVIFTKGYEAASVKGSENILSVLRKLRTLGYDTAGVFDVSGRFDETMWEKASSEFDGIIPYVHNQTQDTENALREMFRDVFTASF